MYVTVVRIFISYADEDRDVAKRILHSIKGRGHKVFFADAAIHAGSNYEQIIENEIKRSNIFLFLASSASLSEGRFTWTELRIAEDTRPVAENHVLPVILDETKVEELPAYLRSVSVLKPVGDVAAETAIAVQGLSKDRGNIRKILRFLVAVSIAVVLLIGGLFVATLRPLLNVSVLDPVRLNHGFFSDDALHMVNVRVENAGRREADEVAAHIEVRDGPDAAPVRLSPTEARGTVLPQSLVPNGSRSTRLDVMESAIEGKDWRGCVSQLGSEPVCTEFIAWATPPLTPNYGRLDASLRGLVIDFAVTGEAVYVLLSTREILRIADDGVTRVPLKGQPVTLSAGDHGLYVATSIPNQIERLEPTSLVSIGASSIVFPLNSFGEPVSTTPDVIIPYNSGVWVITRGNESENGLVWKSIAEFSGQSSRPTFYEEIAFDLPGIDPHPFELGLVSGSSDTTPATLWLWNYSDLWSFSGHDYEVVSCAHGVTAKGTDIFVPDCDGNLVRLQLTGLENDWGIQKTGDLGKIEGYGPGVEAWPETVFHVLDSGAVITATALTRRSAWGTESFATVIGKNEENEVSRIDQIQNARVLRIQSRGDQVWFLLENEDRNARELVWLHLEN